MNLELNKRVAELLGWTDLNVVPAFGGNPPRLVGRHANGKYENAPDYSGDLNAIQDAVISLDDEKQGIFRRHLADVIQVGSGFSKTGHATMMSKEAYSKWFNADAAQRCEAFIRTMEGKS